jgi:putative acetyltransferase
MGLAPMAVLPAYQRQGIGSVLVRSGLAVCQALGYGAVVVLGHPSYYPRFGFVPTDRTGLRCLDNVPVEAFMMLELQPGYLQDVQGIVTYHPAFDDV